MSQSTFIFTAIALAFLVFITLRGELPAYLSIFTGGTATPQTGAPADGKRP